MTPAEKRKFLEAIDEVERAEGTDAALSPRAILGLFLASFPAVWEELKEALATAQALQLIAARQGPAIRSRRSGAAQMTLALPGFDQVKIPVAIRIPPATRKGEPTKMHTGRWGKTMEVPVKDFGLYLRRQEERVKDASARQLEKIKAMRQLYRIARAGAKGDFDMPMKDALASQAAKKKAKEAGFGVGWLFT